jgi:hypothetical protein
MTSTENNTGDWTDHIVGDECPVPTGTLIDVMDMDGFVWTEVRALDETATAAQFWIDAAWDGLCICKWRIAS